MKVGLILIGDELLNGSRQDRHLAHAIKVLKQRGMSLTWVRIVSDEAARLLQTFQETLASPDIVFSFGGIGATPDDLTRPCVAKACGVDLQRHPEAAALIEARFAEQAYPNRILMADLPAGARIIPNPVNQVAGFSIHHHHCLPGFPSMAWPMMEWVLDHYYQAYFSSNPDVDWRWYIFNTPESDLLNMMQTLMDKFAVRISSLPSTKDRSLIDFGIKGEQTKVEKAAVWLEEHLNNAKIDFKRQTIDQS
jgi:molybdopterin-biosynthesis enzyme MoeA-like protein